MSVVWAFLGNYIFSAFCLCHSAAVCISTVACQKSPLASLHFIYVTSSFTFDLYRPPHHCFFLSFLCLYFTMKLCYTDWSSPTFCPLFSGRQIQSKQLRHWEEDMEGSRGERERDTKIKETVREEKTKQRWCCPHAFLCMCVTLWLWRTLQLAGQQIGVRGRSRAWGRWWRQGWCKKEGIDRKYRREEKEREREKGCVCWV